MSGAAIDPSSHAASQAASNTPSRKRKAQGEVKKAAKKSRNTSHDKRGKTGSSASASTTTSIASSGSINPDIAHMDGSLLADYFARQVKKFEPDLDIVSMEDRRIPATSFVDTTRFSETRDLNALPGFIQQFSKTSAEALKETVEVPGHPHTLVISAAALRCVDIVRCLRIYQGDRVKIAKMFAKHIKLSEAIEFTKKTRINVGVGTPQRIMELFESGALSSEHLERVVVDVSWLNVKNKSILDQPESEQALSILLSRMRLNAPGKDLAILAY